MQGFLPRTTLRYLTDEKKIKKGENYQTAVSFYK